MRKLICRREHHHNQPVHTSISAHFTSLRSIGCVLRANLIILPSLVYLLLSPSPSPCLSICQCLTRGGSWLRPTLQSRTGAVSHAAVRHIASPAAERILLPHSGPLSSPPHWKLPRRMIFSAALPSGSLCHKQETRSGTLSKKIIIII